MKPLPPARRDFLSAAAAVAVGAVWPAPSSGRQAASETLHIGVIGVGGRGVDNIAGVAGESIAALCDVDERPLAEMASRYRRAKTYRDFRKLLEQQDLDAVIVATPNHTHAVVAVTAMRRGLHVYCEKPLAHNLHETQLLAHVARQTKVATQMGNQHHSSAGYRRAVQILQSAALGEVREVHAWTSRPTWPQGMAERPKEMPVPAQFDWDLWLGPAAARPYSAAYLPRDWRGWWDFGGGALGDFLPHILDPVFEGLKLGAPQSIAAESSPVSEHSPPAWSIVRFAFGQRGEFPPATVTWYDGGKQPPAEITGVKRLPPGGALVLGERGKLFVPELGKAPVAVAHDKRERLELPDQLPSPEHSHWQNWLIGCKTGAATSSDFQYGAALSEMALLGNIALRAGAKITWDAKDRRISSPASANQFLSRENREGWELH